MDTYQPGRTHRRRLSALAVVGGLLVAGLAALPTPGYADQLMATIAVPKPSGITRDAATGLLYVGSEFDSHIQVIDPETNTLLTPIDLPVGSGAADIAIDSARGLAYATERYLGAGDELFVIDLAQGQVVDRIGGLHRPWGVTVGADPSTVYVADQFGEAVVVIDAHARTIARSVPMPSGSYPTFLAEDDGTGRLFVTTQHSSGVAVVDMQSWSVTDHLPVTLSLGVALDAAAHRLFVSAHAGDFPTVAFDTRTLAEVSRQPSNYPPYGISVDAVSGRLYVARANSLWIGSTDDLSVRSTVAISGSSFQSLATDPTTRTTYVADYMTDRVHVVGSRLARVAPRPVTFTDIEPGTTAAATATVTSKGRLPVTVTGFSLTGPDADHFSIGDVTCPGTPLARGSTCQVTVMVSPPGRDSLTAQLGVASDDDDGVAPVPLSARWTPETPGVTPPPAPEPPVVAPDPTPTTTPEPPVEPVTELAVQARDPDHAVPVRGRTVLVHRASSNAHIAVHVRCQLRAGRLPRRAQRHLCGVEVTRDTSSRSVRVTAAPTCSALRLYVQIHAQAAGAPGQRWHRHWHTDATPPTPCRLPGTG